MREPRGSGCVPAQTQLQALAGAPEIHVPATSLGMGPFVQMGLCQYEEGKDVRCSSWVGPVLNAATGVLVRHRRGYVATEKLTLTRPPHLAGGQLWPCVYFLVTRVTGVSPLPCRGGAVFLVGACVLWVPSALRAVEMGWGGRCPGDQQGVIPGGEKGPRAQRCARPGVPSPGRPSEHVASREGVGRIAPLAGRCGGAADVGEPELCGTADSPVLLGRSPGPEGTTSPGGSGSVPGPFNEGPHLVVPHHTRL